ncbi:heterokaryon incompatibility protein-domain-containing protein [Podospora didyma]|uniref:Heterokaryon incompatibility protein-domain-containing protein n=1 Tax=Podospora didyma TaxID=330526 RepID=A0AAE0KE90_9PEZI|nr:heterokaryon incompatibility protein-domain-containing protein [Podospora didyma]
MARIPVETLPKTFQDTVNFTRRLGIRYIWIDAICIVQGDEKNWLHESAKMCDVYGHAHLTLASAHSPDSEGGLYSRVDPPVHIAVPIHGSEYNLLTRKTLSIYFCNHIGSTRFLRNWIFL